MVFGEKDRLCGEKFVTLRPENIVTAVLRNKCAGDSLLLNYYTEGLAIWIKT